MNKRSKPIYVTQPVLPDFDTFVGKIAKLWETKILTNNGPFHEEFEDALKEYLDVPYLSLFSNGTMALIAAFQTLRIQGEVITSPYSFVATTHALYWNRIKPVFCDTDPIYGNLDHEKIESLITPDTTAILPIHVYGNPAKIEEIQKIADTYRLKVIYDAAHAFGIKYKNQSVLNYGDLSILSFHATKSFNTIEGGAVICQDKETKEHLHYLKNFGFADEVTVVAPGINAKMNEFQAAYGLLQLNDYDKQVAKRKEVALRYRKLLEDVVGIRVLSDNQGTTYNYGYFPIFVDDNYTLTRDELYTKLKENNIYGRRYFYPLISSFPSYRNLPSAHPSLLTNAQQLANQVICLPIYPELTTEEIDYIVNLII